MKKVEFGNAALEYIQYSLSLGSSLSKLFLQSINIKNCDIYTVVPDDTEIDGLTDFYHGGKINYKARNPGENVIPVTPFTQYVVKFINVYLNENRDNHVCIFEQPILKSTDPCIKRNESQYLYHNEEVYIPLSLIDKTSYDIESVLKKATMSFPPLTAILTGINDNVLQLLSSKHLTNITIHKLVKNTRYVLIGAYDGEGYLILSRKQEKW